MKEEDNRLIPMTEFVQMITEHLNKEDWYGYKESISIALKLIINYKNFLTMEPHPGMFVICDIYGNLLQIPKESEFDDKREYAEAAVKYVKAEAEVLFEGWSYGTAKELNTICPFLYQGDKENWRKNKHIELKNTKILEFARQYKYKSIESYMDLGLIIKERIMNMLLC